MTYIQYRDINFKRATLAIINQCNFFIEEFQADGYTPTLRQLYYAFVANVPGYENSEHSYKNLGNIVSDARVAGLISWDAIEDRVRGLDDWLIQEDQREALRNIEMLHFARDLWTPQNVYVEVWPEKDAVSGIVARSCQKYRVPYMACRGYLSTSEAWSAGQRFQQAMEQGKRCVVIHLGDHDPSGIDMTRDNDVRLELFAGYGVELKRIALTYPQIEQYKPPANPTKIKDKRSAGYIRLYGHECWELDALKPKVIDALISSAIEALWTDKNAWDQTLAEEAETRKPLAALHGHWPKVRDYMAKLDKPAPAQELAELLLTYEQTDISEALAALGMSHG